MSESGKGGWKKPLRAPKSYAAMMLAASLHASELKPREKLNRSSHRNQDVPQQCPKNWDRDAAEASEEIAVNATSNHYVHHSEEVFKSSQPQHGFMSCINVENPIMPTEETEDEDSDSFDNMQNFGSGADGTRNPVKFQHLKPVRRREKFETKQFAIPAGVDPTSRPAKRQNEKAEFCEISSIQRLKSHSFAVEPQDTNMRPSLAAVPADSARWKQMPPKSMFKQRAQNEVHRATMTQGNETVCNDAMYTGENCGYVSQTERADKHATPCVSRTTEQQTRRLLPQKRSRGEVEGHEKEDEKSGTSDEGDDDEDSIDGIEGNLGPTQSGVSGRTVAPQIPPNAPPKPIRVVVDPPGGPFQCPHCPKQFSLKGNREKHVRAIHLLIRAFVCPICGHSSSYKRNLDRHVLNVHHRLKPFHCPDCMRSFSQKTNIRTHLKLVHGVERPFPRPHPCRQCHMAFDTKARLKSHTAANHHGKFAWACTLCGKGYKWRRSLRKHMAQKHDIGNMASSTIPGLVLENNGPNVDVAGPARARNSTGHGTPASASGPQSATVTHAAHIPQGEMAAYMRASQAKISQDVVQEPTKFPASHLSSQTGNEGLPLHNVMDVSAPMENENNAQNFAYRGSSSNDDHYMYEHTPQSQATEPSRLEQFATHIQEHGHSLIAGQRSHDVAVPYAYSKPQKPNVTLPASLHPGTGRDSKVSVPPSCTQAHARTSETKRDTTSFAGVKNGPRTSGMSPVSVYVASNRPEKSRIRSKHPRHTEP